MKKSFIPIVFFFALAAGFGFVGNAKAAIYTYTEDFSSVMYKDSSATTAEWNTTDRKVQLPENSSIKFTSPRATRTSLGGTLTENRIYLVFGKYAKSSAEAYLTNSSIESELYLQAQTESGFIRWTTKVSDKPAAYNRYNPIVKTDTSDGYVYVIWVEGLDLLSSYANIMAQKFDANGNKLWGDGIKLIDSINFDSGGQYSADIQMFSGYSNYIFLVYSDKIEGKTVVKKLDPSTGSELWKQTIDVYRGYVSIRVSGQVYVIYQKQEGFGSNHNIYIAKFDNTLGNQIWNKKVHNDTTSVMRTEPKVFERDSFITVTWIDFRNGRRDIFAQKFDTDGNKQWSNEIEAVADMKTYYDAGVDWNNNLYVVWNSQQNELRMQKFGPNGSKSYTDSVVINNKYISEFFNNTLTMAGSGAGAVYWASGLNNRVYGEIFDGQSISFGGKKFNIAFYSITGSAIAQSIKINTVSEKITKATLTASENKDSNTIISYYLSADGGSHWEQVTLGSEHNFSYSGSDLRWKIALSSSNENISPFLSSVSISYTAITEPSLSVPTQLSPSNGSTTTFSAPFSWQAVSGASYYQYKVYDSSGNEIRSRTISDTKEGFSVDKGTYTWKVRACSATTASDSTCGLWSSTWTFTAASASVQVTYPNGGERFEKGKIYEIKWSLNNLPQAKCSVDLWKSSMQSAFKVLTGSDMMVIDKYSWTAPADLSEAEKYKIGVRCLDKDGYGTYADQSDNDFTVVSVGGQKSITVSYPNGNEVWEIGKTYTIKWTSSGINKASILIQTYGFSGWGTSWIDLGNNPGNYQFTVPDTAASNTTYKVTVRDAEANPIYDVDGRDRDSSDNYFTITVASVSQLAEGSLVKSPSDPTVYVIKDGKKQPIASPQEFEQSGYKWDQIKTVQSDLLKQIEDLKAQISQLREELKKAGTLIKNPNSPEVYVITPEGKKEHIFSPEQFAQKGYKWDQIKTVTQDEISQIPDFTPGQKEEGIYPNGTLIKSENDPTVYIIVNGKKRSIPNPATFNNWGLKWDQIKEVPASQTGQFEDVKVSSDIVRAQGDNKIYRIIGDKKLWIPTVQAFLGSGYKPNSEIDITQDELSDFEDIKYIKVKGGRYVYEIKGDKKYRITDTSQIPAQDIKPVTLAEFVAYPIGK